MEKNDFNLTNEMLEQILGGKNSEKLFQMQLTPENEEDVQKCSTVCTTDCNGLGTRTGTDKGIIYPSEPVIAE